MKQKDIVLLAVVGVITAIFSVFVSGLLFGGHKSNANVPTAAPISTTFPDVKNDPTLSSIFNNGALDPAQAVPVDTNNQHTQPFNGSSQ